jgi:hypothetical protein
VAIRVSTPTVPILPSTRRDSGVAGRAESQQYACRRPSQGGTWCALMTTSQLAVKANTVSTAFIMNVM